VFTPYCELRRSFFRLADCDRQATGSGSSLHLIETHPVLTFAGPPLRSPLSRPRCRPAEAVRVLGTHALRSDASLDSNVRPVRPLLGHVGARPRPFPSAPTRRGRCCGEARAWEATAGRRSAARRLEGGAE